MKIIDFANKLKQNENDVFLLAKKQIEFENSASEIIVDLQNNVKLLNNKIENESRETIADNLQCENDIKLLAEKINYNDENIQALFKIALNFETKFEAILDENKALKNVINKIDFENIANDKQNSNDDEGDELNDLTNENVALRFQIETLQNENKQYRQTIVDTQQRDTLKISRIEKLCADLMIANDDE